MSAWAKPGVKCVCIAEVTSGPAVGETCTITKVQEHKGRLYLYLDGYDAWQRIGECHLERRSWCCTAFRPLISRTQEQDLEHFLPLLNTVEEPA